MGGGPEGLVSVVATPEDTTYPTGLLNTLRVLFDVKTTENKAVEKAPRVPLNICFILDRSGSMEGEKIDFAKKAIKHALTLLKEEDIFHMVEYSSTVCYLW
jgi:Mg-chelatase subunit ChlD